MKLLSISKTTTLKELSNMVGYNNVTDMLVANNLSRTPDIGKQFYDMTEKLKSQDTNIDYIPSGSVMTDRKMTVLKDLMDDSDIFEKACLSTNKEWQVISKLATFSGYLKIPEKIAGDIPLNASIIGNGVPVSGSVYNSVMDSLKNTGEVDVSVFSTYDGLSVNNMSRYTAANADYGRNAVNTWFKIPFHEITLYSNLMDGSVDIPAYPDSISDGVSASYDTMSDLLYQYEPWLYYSHSGPRELTFTFELHRDMWTGDRKDGLANEMIRFCEANCYADYKGAIVNTPIVTLYIHGSAFITGVMTSCKTNWNGPLGDDGWYLCFTLEFTIKEVSKMRLNMEAQRNKSLIQ